MQTHPMSLANLNQSGAFAVQHQVNMHEVKTHLSRLIEDTEAGREVVIAKAGKPVA